MKPKQNLDWVLPFARVKTAGESGHEPSPGRDQRLLLESVLKALTCCRDALGVMKASGVISLGLVSFDGGRKSTGTDSSEMRRKSGWEPWMEPFSEPRPSMPMSAR